jgi:hypothetical protein
LLGFLIPDPSVHPTAAAADHDRLRFPVLSALPFAFIDVGGPSTRALVGTGSNLPSPSPPIQFSSPVSDAQQAI